MEPEGIHGVSVVASANALNPLHSTEDEGAKVMLESSFGAPSEKDRVVLTNTRALQGEHPHTAAFCCGGDSMPDGSESPKTPRPADASETLQSRSSRTYGESSAKTSDARAAQPHSRGFTQLLSVQHLPRELPNERYDKPRLADASETIQSRSSRTYGGLSATTFDARAAQALPRGISQLLTDQPDLPRELPYERRNNLADASETIQSRSSRVAEEANAAGIIHYRIAK